MIVDQTRSLLVGLLALKDDLVSATDLVAATEIWLGQKERTLDRILVEQFGLKESARVRLLPSATDEIRRIEDHIAEFATSESNRCRAEAADSEYSSTLPWSKSIAETTLKYVQEACADRNMSNAGPMTVSRYRVERFHAKGGLGTISFARDLELGRHVALKEIQTQFCRRSRMSFEIPARGGSHRETGTSWYCANLRTRQVRGWKAILRNAIYRR